MLQLVSSIGLCNYFYSSQSIPNLDINIYLLGTTIWWAIGNSMSNAGL